MSVAIAQAESKKVSKKMSFEEFLEFDDGTENSDYELENGELILMPFESEIDRRITSFLFIYLLCPIGNSFLSVKYEDRNCGA